MNERTEYLRKKALRLPLSPGVYIMKNARGEVIYVGKSAALKNRVSQYFSGSAKNRKTEMMVSSVYDFDYILCDTETEALALENVKIKQYEPKYNIKLKDDKNYPYIKITKEEYPRLVTVRSRTGDGGKYFGPYTNSATCRGIVRSVSQTAQLPTCGRTFPRDIGKTRPCVYYQIGRCCAPCTGKISRDEYAEYVKEAENILKGDITDEKNRLTALMERAAEELNFELAANCRDRIKALEALYDKQKVVSSPDTFADAVGIYTDDDMTVVSFFFIRAGMISDTEVDEFVGGHIGAEELSAFIASVYDVREPAREILVSSELPQEEADALSAHLTEKYGRKTEVRVTLRGKNKALCAMARENASFRAKLLRESTDRETQILGKLAQTLRLEVVPDRIESYDISNFGNDNITAGMIVLEGTKFKKSDYRVFNIKETEHEDDYTSMRETIRRRIRNTTVKKSPAFPVLPDLILLDGGRTHVAAVRSVLEEEGVDIPVFGMVKDDYHKTRALCDDENDVDISRDKALYMFIYRVQEEVHRFAITRMSSAKRKTLKTSSLEKIKGIGPAKAKLLLSTLGSLTAVKNATADQLTSVPGITEKTAEEIMKYFKKDD